jgi:hypothetical protein
MNINAVIGLIALVLVVGGGAWLYSSQSKGEGALTPTEQAAGTSGTYADIVGRSGSWTCDVSVAISEAPAEGVVKIADGKIRADYTVTPPQLQGRTMVAHMIQADGYAYMWTDIAPQGAKIMVQEGATPPGAPGLSDQVSYTCSPWTADAASFAVPAEVKFVDFNPEGAARPM